MISNYSYEKDKYKITYQDSNYIMYQYTLMNRWGMGSTYYRLEGNEKQIEDRIKEEKNIWPPEGYGTRFTKISSKDGLIIYEGSRGNSCD